MKKLALGLLPLLVLGGFACKKSEPPPPPPTTAAPTTTLPAAPSVGGVTLGNAIGADKKVAASSESEMFGAKDTIYASVDTAGTGHVKLRALWSFVKGEKTAKVDETTIEFESAGPATNEFHVSKPSGWPKGDYRIEIFLNDAPSAAATRTFKVG